MLTDDRLPGARSSPPLDLTGQHGRSTVVARGKHLLTRIGDGDTLHTHLKMEGSWHLYRPGERVAAPGARGPGRAARPTSGRPSGSRSASSSWCARDDEDTVVGHLGPDLLGPDWDAGRGAAPAAGRPRPRRSPRRCSTSATSPASATSTRASSASSPACTRAAGRRGAATCRGWSTGRSRLLDANRDRVEQTTTGDTRRGRQHWVYRRDRQPCRRCGSPDPSSTSRDPRARSGRRTGVRPASPAH